MSTITVTCPAKKFADSDDCLEDARVAAVEANRSKGARLDGAEARWADEQRDEIIVEIHGV
jgi:hypothetical protein